MGGLRVPNRILILVLGILVAAGVLWAFAGLARYPEEELKGEWLMWTIVSLRPLVEQNPGTEHIAAMFDEARSLYPQRPSSLDFGGSRLGDYIKPATGHVYLEEGTVIEGAQLLSVSHPELWEERQASAERKLELLRTILQEHPLPPWGDLAAMYLGYALVSLERYEEAIPVLERAMASLHQQYSEIHVPLQLSRVYRRLARYDDAERTLRRALQVSNSVDLLHALAEVLEENGDLEQAHATYLSLAKSNDRYVSDSRRAAFAEKERVLRDRLEKRVDADHGAVTGRVELNGTGLSKVRVYLVHDINRSVWPGSSIRAAETVTDSLGDFAFYGVPVGRYRVGVEVPAEVVYGALVRFDAGVVRVGAEAVLESNILFERTPRIVHAELQGGDVYPILSVAWEPDPRAEAYTLLMNLASGASPTTYQLPAHEALPTRETAVQIPIDDWFTGPFHHQPPILGTKRNATLLGVRMPETRLHIQVIPLDETGQPLLGSQVAWRAPVSQSSSHVAVVEMPEYPLSDGDQLVAAGNYAEAVAAYERHLAEDPDDIKSLEILASLLQNGADSWGTLQDKARAEELYKRIAALKGANE